MYFLIIKNTKKGLLGFYIWRSFTQLQRTFYAKKKFYNDKKELF